MKLMFCKTIIYSVGLVANKNANSNSERVLILHSIFEPENLSSSDNIKACVYLIWKKERFLMLT